MPAKRTKNKILVDEGDPAETSKIKELLGFVDGQTTNPSLIAKNSEIRKLVALGRRLSRQQENEEYKANVATCLCTMNDAAD
jgi:transaldolase